MNISLGTDHAGYRYKESIKRFLQEEGHEVKDCGCHSEEAVDYPRFVRPAAEAVSDGTCQRGIVLGGSGNGEAMVANRLSGVRCALCWNRETASLARRHNDANVLSLGARMISLEQALEIVRIWLEEPFDGGRHLSRIRQIDEPLPPHPPRASKEGDVADAEASHGEPAVGSATDFDVLVSFRFITYSEGRRSLELTLEPGLKHPTIINVPSPSRWEREMPEWARGRREEILERIRPKCSHLNCEWRET